MTEISVRDMGASGSDASTTGTVSGTSLTLTDALDFRDRDGITIDHAGPACTLATPTGVAASKVNAGSTTYTYHVAALTAAGGVSVPSSACSISGCVDTLEMGSGWVDLSWQPVAGAVAYAIWADSHGTMVLRTIVPNAGTSWTDYGQPNLRAYPCNVPRTLPTAATNEHHITEIDGGAGTTSLTLRDAAPNGGSGLRVGHDDTRAITFAIARAKGSQSDLYFPAGTYLLTQHAKFVECHGMTVRGAGQARTFIQDASLEQTDLDLYGTISAIDCDHFTVEDLTLLGQSTAGTAYRKKAVYSVQVGYGLSVAANTVRRVTALYHAGESIYAHGEIYVVWKDLDVRDGMSNGLNINSAYGSGTPTASGRIRDCRVLGCTGAALLAGGELVTCSGSEFANTEHCGSDVVNLCGVEWVEFTRNIIHSSHSDGFGVQPLRLGFPTGGGNNANFNVSGIVADNIIRNNVTSTEGNGLGGTIYAQQCKGPLTIERNLIANNGRAGGTNHAIEIDGAETGMIVVRDNTIASDGQTTVGVVIRASANTGVNADITVEGNTYSSDIDPSDHVIIEAA